MSDLLPPGPARESIQPRLPVRPASPLPSIKLEPPPASGRDLVLQVRVCRVPQCPNRHCNLRSHRLYDPAVALSRQSQAQAHQHDLRKEPKLQPQPQPLGHGHDIYFSSSGIGRKGVDGFPSLPLENPLETDLRALFHHFFDSVFDRLADIFRGPLQGPDYKNRMLSVALTDEAYCMGLITQAQTDTAIARGSFGETTASLQLYTKLIRIFRVRLAASTGGGTGTPQPAHIEIALLILCILLSYNATRGRFNELVMNWNAMRHLVNMRGGIHYLTVALAYVVHVDRLCATMLGLHPTYSVSSPLTMHQHQFCRPAWSTYGSGFTTLERSQEHSFSHLVLEHSLNTCELLSLYEARQAATAAPSSFRRGPFLQRPRPFSPEYLYYRRDRVDEQFAVLYADLLNESTPSKCILLATRIVEYPVTWANYVPTLTIHLCTELCTILRRQDLFQGWSGLLDVLRWILFAMVTSPWPFDGRDWAMSSLQGLIGAKYGPDHWPDRWWEEELKNLQDFAWSRAHDAKLGQMRRELDKGYVDTTTQKGAQKS
ncbi:uncharacterized protein Z518_03865 [Rhinocladiella mackenziei CBS 650.93]|uniref:Transcription factor domain-containing protein n=1 Tax=Rhinocladiella mackenziei CBS 650.93 TaxID=1442369 RepID=A0A0D2FUX8_9EURO|nr:uncharacterized protein Z518_03865 [Rhinocladiella mackenziei CBS 650.93]KIX05892.1 hypothetical protein Z518_03865 [Rhinocladiella mackenziei CBS 650.93]